MSLDTHQAQIITEVYNKMYKQLLAYVRNSLGQEYLVEESVQDTFRIACAKYDEFISSPNPEGWLIITLRNIIRNTRREQAKLSRMFVKAISSGDEVYSESYIIAAEDKNIEKAETNLYFSGMLTKDEYFLLTLVAIYGYSTAEAARVFGITAEACKKRVQRIKKKLKKLLDENF